MKKFTNILALGVAAVLCVSLMTACSGGKEDPTTTQKPGTSTTTKPEADKNEGSNKPAETKPQETKPEDTTPEQDSKPEESKPEESKPEESKPEDNTTDKDEATNK